MIILDTHIWVWWVHGAEPMTLVQEQIIEENESEEIGVSIISLWEIAKLVQYQRLELPCSIDQWFGQATHYPGVRILGMTPEIVVESTKLPGEFHRDPADQIIVATARIYDCPLITSDKKILDYPHVESIK